jgi:hypothetical protein
MTTLGATSPSEDSAASQKVNFENLLFAASPLGTVSTAVLLFGLLILAYGVIATSAGISLYAFVGGKLHVQTDTRFATVLSLILATTLALSRFARVDTPRNIEALTRIFSGGERSAAQFASLVPHGTRLRRATVISLIVGAGVSLLNGPHGPVAAFVEGKPTAFWFTAVTLSLIVLFGRGIEMSRARWRLYQQLIDSELEIELLRIDRLSVIGRTAARLAASWFIGSGVVLLLLLGSTPSVGNLIILLFCAAMGVWMFVAMMLRVHERIRAAKENALDAIFVQLHQLRGAALDDADAAVKAEWLLAYETKIASASEWPFDQTTLVRLGASALILTVPWFGQALAGYVVERVNEALH